MAAYRCLVFGAASGIGRAVADRLARAGASVAGADLPHAHWPEAGGPEHRIAVDVSEEQTVAAAVETCLRTLGGLDAVVNCAGVLGRVQPAAEETAEEFERTLRINLIGAFTISRIVLPIMAEQGFGRLVHISSTAGKEGVAHMTGYSASKAGILGLVKALGKEYATTGVTVNAVAPATIETPLLKGMSPERQQKQRALIPMGRFGTPDEAAALIEYILSPAASFTTGFAFDLSGGRATY